MTNKTLITLLTPLYFITPLSAKNLLQNIECGAEFNASNFTTHAPKKDITCHLESIPQEITQKIEKIENYQTLFHAIGRNNLYRLYHDKTNLKLLDNIFINQYTLTYLFYKKVVNFKKTLETSLDIDMDIDTVVKEIDYGGEYIALIQIKTDSQKTYALVSKKINKKILSTPNLNLLQSLLKSISEKHQIIIKEYTTEGISPIKSNSINIFFNNFKRFQEKIKDENQPINFKTSYPPVKMNIDTLLNYHDIKNNLYYIKTHNHEFNIKKPFKYNKKYNEINEKIIHIKRERNQENNLSIPIVVYPRRYEASTAIQPIQTKPFSLSINKINSYPRIDDKITFNLSIELRLDIKRNGKVLIETIKTTVYENKKSIKHQENSHIKLDTFVNYSKLKFSKIKNHYFGKLNVDFIFDRYEQEKKIKGEGLIDEATCGYKVDTNNELNFECHNITLKPIEIEFTHAE